MVLAIANSEAMFSIISLLAIAEQGAVTFSLTKGDRR
jgi:hypothetical protein